MNYSTSSSPTSSYTYTYDSDSSYDDGSTSFDVFRIDSADKHGIPHWDCVTFRPHEKISYRNLIRKLEYCFPDIKYEEYYLTCIDEYGRTEAIDDDGDLEFILNEFDCNYNIFIIFNDEIENSSGEPCFSPYYCNFCAFALVNFRFQCEVCPGYDLCNKCRKEGIHAEHKLINTNIVFPEHTPSMELNMFRYSDLIDEKKIGEGTFGVVHRVQCSSTKQTVAVKFFKNPVGKEKSFLKEMRALEEMGLHENVVRVLGYVFGNVTMGVVMELVTMKIDGREISGLSTYFMHLRDLYERGKFVNPRELDSFALQIARGMEHLELRGVLHRDLASRNILIDSDKNLKITDFGVSRLGDNYHSDHIFAVRWAAPEVLKNKGYSHESDVWAFGVVLWEIATLGGLPFEEKTNDEVISFVENYGHLRKTKNVSDKLFDIMVACWAPKPDRRPCFSTLVEKLLDFKWMESAYIAFHEIDTDFALPKAVNIYERRYNQLNF